jgi:hypothetical protein
LRGTAKVVESTESAIVAVTKENWTMIYVIEIDNVGRWWFVEMVVC